MNALYGEAWKLPIVRRLLTRWRDRKWMSCFSSWDSERFFTRLNELSAVFVSNRYVCDVEVATVPWGLHNMRIEELAKRTDAATWEVVQDWPFDAKEGEAWLKIGSEFIVRPQDGVAEVMASFQHGDSLFMVHPQKDNF